MTKFQGPVWLQGQAMAVPIQTARTPTGADGASSTGVCCAECKSLRWHLNVYEQTGLLACGCEQQVSQTRRGIEWSECI